MWLLVIGWPLVFVLIGILFRDGDFIFGGLGILVVNAVAWGLVVAFAGDGPAKMRVGRGQQVPGEVHLDRGPVILFESVI